MNWATQVAVFANTYCTIKVVLVGQGNPTIEEVVVHVDDFKTGGVPSPDYDSEDINYVHQKLNLQRMFLFMVMSMHNGLIHQKTDIIFGRAFLVQHNIYFKC